MAAAPRNITVEIGATFQKTWSLENSDTTPFDLTGFTVEAQIREDQDSKYPVATFTGSIIGPPTDGVLQIAIARTVTELLKPSKNIWDLRIVSGTSTIRLLAGIATIVRGATH